MSDAPKVEWVALVGPRDEPVDGVRDYCHFLAEALERRGIALKEFEVPWAERGWTSGLLTLWREAKRWRGRWVLLQYTPLAWSRRGFTFPAIWVTALLRWRGARVAAVFHDWTGFPGDRAIDRFRRGCQHWTMRRIASLAERSTFPTLPAHVGWLRARNERAAFIPIGANLATRCAGEKGEERAEEGSEKTVAVYGVNGGRRGREEAELISATVVAAGTRLEGKLRLVVLGRGSNETKEAFEEATRGRGVDVAVLGLLSTEQVAKELARADALLFVRGPVEAHRGSAIAGIACGIPVVGYGSVEGAFPLTEGGLVLAPRGDVESLAEAVARVLGDRDLRQALRKRSERAREEFFSWDRVAARFGDTLKGA